MKSMKKDCFQDTEDECSMMAKRFFFVLGLLGAMTACASNPKWQGEYIYEADFGENAAEQPVLIEYLLEVGDGSCKLSIQGYQVFETILCSAGSNEKTLSIHFKSYEDGSMKNTYGIQIYTTGQRLFWLDNASITHWDAMVPDESVAKSGKYFLKTAQ